MADKHQRWWMGSRGEWLVVIQVVLIGLVFFGPRGAGSGWTVLPWPGVCRTVGPVVMVAGLALLIAGGLKLGPGLTPLPYPKEGGRLLDSGPFGVVRHPMYSGGLLLALGWAFTVCSWLTLAYTAVLFAFLDLKSRREEMWLSERFPNYRDYQRRVCRLIPFLY